MENLKRQLQQAGHYAAIFEGSIITNSMLTIREEDRGYILTDDQDGKEMLFGTAEAVIAYMNINGNIDMMEFMSKGLQDRGFFLLQTHTAESVSENRRKALVAANKYIRALEDLLAAKRSTTKLTHCEICNTRLSKEDRDNLGTECRSCADSLRETMSNIAKVKGGKNNE